MKRFDAERRRYMRECGSPVQHSDKRVTPLVLDVTNASQIQRAVGAVDTLDVLINNAGIAIYDDLSNLECLNRLSRSISSVCSE